MTPYYEDDWATIYHGDCLELIGQFAGPDLFYTDPPFSNETQTNAKSNKGVGHGVAAIDFAAIDFAAIERFLDLAKPARWAVMHLDFRHACQLLDRHTANLECVRLGSWVKTNPMPQISADRPAQGWESIAYLHRADVKKRWNGGGSHGNYVTNIDNRTDHPTSKPIEIARSIVERFSDPVLDLGGVA